MKDTDIMDIDPEQFRAWLDGHEGLDLVGRAGEQRDCPLARYLSGRVGKPNAYWVGQTNVHGRGRRQRLPGWAIEFVRLVDVAAAGTPVTANTARDLLRRAVP